MLVCERARAIPLKTNRPSRQTLGTASSRSKFVARAEAVPMAHRVVVDHRLFWRLSIFGCDERISSPGQPVCVGYRKRRRQKMEISCDPSFSQHAAR